MLPGPDACWLTDEHGHHYTSELRLVAVDSSALRPGSTASRAAKPEPCLERSVPSSGRPQREL